MAKKRHTLKDFEQDIDIISLSEIYTEVGLRRRKEKPLNIGSLMIAIENRTRVLTQDLGLLRRVVNDMGADSLKTKEGAFLLYTLNKLNALKDEIFAMQGNNKQDPAKVEAEVTQISDGEPISINVETQKP